MNANQILKQCRMMAALGTIAAAPLVGVANAQTVPSNGEQRYAQNEDRRGQVRVVGVVTREIRNDQFRMRDDDGTTYRVSVERVDNVRVAVGDRIEVAGRWDGQTLTARRITQLGINPGGGGSNIITRRGTVSTRIDDASFDMNGEDGRTYRVRARNGDARRFRVGSTVEVRGILDGNRSIIADSIDFVRDGGSGNNNGGNGSRISRRGVVTNRLDNNTFEIRGDDGNTYTIRTNNNEAQTMNNGDRVEVRGYFDGDRNIVAENIYVEGRDSGGTDGGNGQRVTRRGTVTNRPDNNTFEIRGEDRRTYTIRTNNNEAQTMNVGDRVEVRGYMDGDRTIVAESLYVEGRDGGSTGDNTGQRVTRRGTVINRPDNNTFEIRGEDRNTYTIRTNNNEARTMNTGDRVEVNGYYDGNRTITAETIRVEGRDYGNTGNTGSEGSEGSRADFTGTVLRADRVLVVWVLQVRTDDGNQYQVNYSGNNTFAPNDHVRVIGTFHHGGNITSADITRR